MFAVPTLPRHKPLRFVLQFIGALLVFGAGIELGSQVTWNRAKYWSDAYTYADAELLRGYLLAQSTKGTPMQHEEALRAFLAMLKRQDAHPSGLYPPGTTGFEEALTNVKLAELARARSDFAAAEKYLSSAEEWCRRVKWQDCSTDTVASMGKRLDEERQRHYLD
jgi:hypothetical protein